MHNIDLEIDQAQQPQALVDLLMRVGEHLPPRLEQAILANRATLPALIRVATNPELLATDVEDHAFAPIHAARLLGRLCPPEALEPLVNALCCTEPSDGVYDALIEALTHYGQQVREPALAAYANTQDDEFRNHLCDLLSRTVVDEKVFPLLLQQLARNVEAAAQNLLRYGDARALPALHRALDEMEVQDPNNPFANHGLVALKSAIEGLGGHLSPTQSAKVAMALQEQTWFTDGLPQYVAQSGLIHGAHLGPKPPGT
ncbi:MAG: hypothetical protein AB2A00_05895 [Myxococcota bacterium]